MDKHRKRIYHLCKHTIGWFEDTKHDPVYAAFLLERHFKYVDMLLDG